MSNKSDEPVIIIIASAKIHEWKGINICIYYLISIDRLFDNCGYDTISY